MVGFAHVILHLTLCQAAANLPPSAQIPIKLHMRDATNRQQVDKSFTVERGEAMQRTIEFDVPRGVFEAFLTAPAQRCSAINFWSFMSEENRTMTESLVDGIAPVPRVMLFEGKAPQSFLFLNPQYVLLDKSTQCNAQVGDPIPIQSKIEYDDTSYYVTMEHNELLDGPGRAVLALQIGTPTGEYHYIRLKTPFFAPWQGWPFSFEGDISDATFDGFATQPVDVLLCPRIPMTSVG